jgi:hypothetical protein
MQSPPPLEPKLSLWGRFVSPALEAQFRRYNRPQEIRQLNFALVLSIVGVLPFIPMDYRVYGWTLWFWILAALRSSFMAFTVVMLTLCRREKLIPAADRLLMSWAIASGIGILMVGFTRPAAYVIGFLLSVLGPMLITYFVLPLPLPWQFGLCMLGLTGDVWLVALRRSILGPSAPTAIVVNFVMANVMGVMVAWYMNRLRRQQFYLVQREIGLRHGLEEALSQVKTLQGYLPICAHCKSVRNDEGYWQQVEVYVREHSDAEFTHGICPDCLKEHFGQTMSAKAG